MQVLPTHEFLFQPLWNMVTQIPFYHSMLVKEPGLSVEQFCHKV